MTQIDFKKDEHIRVKVRGNVYIYGKFYDTNKVDIPKEEDNWTGLVVYVNPSSETQRKICSLEGFFVSQNSISLGSHIENPIVNKIDINKFEEKYKGKFIPFGK